MVKSTNYSLMSIKKINDAINLSTFYRKNKLVLSSTIENIKFNINVKVNDNKNYYKIFPVLNLMSNSIVRSKD
jgi:hypothetical protein